MSATGALLDVPRLRGAGNSLKEGHVGASGDKLLILGFEVSVTGRFMARLLCEVCCLQLLDGEGGCSFV